MTWIGAALSLSPDFMRLQRMLDFPQQEMRCAHRSVSDRCPAVAAYLVRSEREDSDWAPVCEQCLASVVRILTLRGTVLVRRLERRARRTVSPPSG